MADRHSLSSIRALMETTHFLLATDAHRPCKFSQYGPGVRLGLERGGRWMVFLGGFVLAVVGVEFRVVERRRLWLRTGPAAFRRISC